MAELTVSEQQLVVSIGMGWADEGLNEEGLGPC